MTLLPETPLYKPPIATFWKKVIKVIKVMNHPVAHSSRHPAWVTDRNGTVLEALLLVTVQDANHRTRRTVHYHRPQWIHCSGGDG